MKRLVCALLVLGAWLGPLVALAHEVRPAYLELRELRPGEFAVLWKTPMRGDTRLALAPVFSGRNDMLTTVSARTGGGAAVQTWRMKAREPLQGQQLRIEGLEATMTDALVRIEFLGGSQWVKRLTAQQPATVIPRQPSAASVAGTYLALGVEHILLGIDHLLFVLALLLVVRGTAPLVKSVTAFTVAHSLTLSLAALGVVHVPQAPVEAAIALSIVFVASQALRARSAAPDLASRAPWVVAFVFGLLHGLGFAGALAETGLPAGHIPLALLLFNIGVEAGQLLFIGLALGCIALLRRTRFPRWAALAPPYAIGTLATFWVFQRVAAF